MSAFQARTISKSEYKFLTVMAAVVAVVGLLGGLLLGFSLTGKSVLDVSLSDGTTVMQSYWSELLKVAGVSALPLVAIAVRIPRAGSGTGWQPLARGLVFIAFPVAIGTIAICLNRVGVTPKDGANPPDALLYLTGAGTGLILAAVALGAAADVLDKIDTE
jgi:hypothetical protein